MITYNAEIHSLGRPGYRLRHPLLITIEEYDDEVIATMPEFDLYAGGISAAIALFWLKHEIVSTYERLNELGVENLGVMPLQCLEAMNAVIVAFKEEGETCQKCGELVRYVWHAPDKLWENVTGFKDGNGILCMECFEALVWEHLHTFLYWSCDIRLYPKHALFHHLRHWWRKMRIKAWLRKQKTDK